MRNVRSEHYAYAPYTNNKTLKIYFLHGEYILSLLQKGGNAQKLYLCLHQNILTGLVVESLEYRLKITFYVVNGAN